jgi:hypothetical protein
LINAGENGTIQWLAHSRATTSSQTELKELPMKKALILALLAISPMISQAVDVNVNLGGTNVNTNTGYRYGDRDKRGYYWDGNTWRDPDYWQKNQGKGQGKGQGQDCPPGQAKKGNCR